MSGFSRRCGCKVGDNEHCHGNAKQAVCDVKRRPVVVAIIDIDEITHESIVEHSVVEVSGYARGEHRQDNQHQRLADAAEQEYRNDYYQGDNRDGYQH